MASRFVSFFALYFGLGFASPLLITLANKEDLAFQPIVVFHRFFIADPGLKCHYQFFGLQNTIRQIPCYCKPRLRVCVCTSGQFYTRPFLLR